MGRRTLLLIASILVAALGTALIWLYVQGADTRAAAQDVNVPVLVATTAVGAGSPATLVQTKVQTLPQSLVAGLGPGVISDRSKISGYVRTDIVPGLPLTTSQFASQPPMAAPVLDLPPGKIGMQVTLPDPQRLAGLLVPQSHIRIYAQVQGKSDKAAVTLFDDVQVLTSGPVTDSQGVKRAVPQANVTLALSNNQAKQLVFAEGNGASLWFGLLGANVKPDDPTSSVDHLELGAK
jgi:pilus assembly protein CpaB